MIPKKSHNQEIHMTQRLGRRAALAWVAGLGAALLPAHAQTFPTKAITIINPFAAGGPADLIARAAAKVLSENLGQPVVIDYKAGGGGSIGAGLAAKAVPDGHTLFLGTSAAHVVNPLVQKTSYDGIKDFEFLGIVANTVNVLVVHPSVPAKNLTEFIALAKSQPGKLNYGSAGQGTTGHLGMELLKLNAGVFIVHVPYRGAAPAVNDLLGGAVQAAMPNLSVVLPMIKAGRLRAIAYATKERSKLIPDVATFAESGMPGYESTTWYSLAAPAGTPPEVLQRLRQAVHALLDSAEYQALMLAQGSEVMKLSAAETLDFVRRDFRQTDALIKSAKIKIEN
jgi:tripartite-type tricarboxylate transporter receptor subunit TctC